MAKMLQKKMSNNRPQEQQIIRYQLSLIALLNWLSMSLQDIYNMDTKIIKQYSKEEKRGKMPSENKGIIDQEKWSELDDRRKKILGTMFTLQIKEGSR